MIKISVLTLPIKLSNFIRLFMNTVKTHDLIHRWRSHLVTQPTRLYFEGEKP